MARFYADPLGFERYVFPWGRDLLAHHPGPDTWQEEFLTGLGAEVAARNFDGSTPVAPIPMTRASGHGIGKSTMSAWLALWIIPPLIIQVHEAEVQRHHDGQHRRAVAEQNLGAIAVLAQALDNPSLV